MQKEILMSIKEKYFTLIMAEKMTLIARKTMPVSKEISFPVKVHLYVPEKKRICGFVIVDEINKDFADNKYCKNTCLTMEEMQEYSGGKELYFWHVEHHKTFKETYALQDYGMKRAPQNWQYISGNKKENTTKAFTAYVDGSFNKATGVYGSGVVLIDADGKERRFQSSGSQYSQYWNVAGELEAAKLAVTKAKELGCTQLKIFHDYEGIGQWAVGYWRAKNFYTQAYVEFIKNCGIKVTFKHVKGHSGDKHNEIADDLASSAAGITTRADDNVYEIIEHAGSVESESAEKKTTIVCIKNIRKFHKKEKHTFKDFVNLKVGGMDYWSKAPFGELADTDPEVLSEIIEALGEGNETASALRWVQRGLTAKEAIHKVKVDEEMSAKYK